MYKTHWKAPNVPRHVCQMLVVDRKGMILLIHRSPTVRSAANVWSMPSGLQEIGETTGTTIERELNEELGLQAHSFEILGQYENIAGDVENIWQPFERPDQLTFLLGKTIEVKYDDGSIDTVTTVTSAINAGRVTHYRLAVEQYHWVITLYLVHVEDCTKLVNKEPDKHDATEIIHFSEMYDRAWLSKYRFHSSLHSYLSVCSGMFASMIAESLERVYPEYATPQTEELCDISGGSPVTDEDVLVELKQRLDSNPDLANKVSELLATSQPVQALIESLGVGTIKDSAIGFGSFPADPEQRPKRS